MIEVFWAGDCLVIVDDGDLTDGEAFVEAELQAMTAGRRLTTRCRQFFVDRGRLAGRRREYPADPTPREPD